MNTKSGFYAVIGGVVGVVLTLAVCSVMPIGAQSQPDATFGKISCSQLEVVAHHGKTVARISSALGNGSMSVYNNKGNRWFHAFLGGITLYNSEGDPGASLRANSMYGLKYLPENIGGELVLFASKEFATKTKEMFEDYEPDTILPWALADTRRGACDCP